MNFLTSCGFFCCLPSERRGPESLCVLGILIGKARFLKALQKSRVNQRRNFSCFIKEPDYGYWGGYNTAFSRQRLISSRSRWSSSVLSSFTSLMRSKCWSRRAGFIGRFLTSLLMVHLTKKQSVSFWESYGSIRWSCSWADD